MPEKHTCSICHRSFTRKQGLLGHRCPYDIIIDLINQNDTLLNKVKDYIDNVISERSNKGVVINNTNNTNSNNVNSNNVNSGNDNSINFTINFLYNVGDKIPDIKSDSKQIITGLCEALKGPNIQYIKERAITMQLNNKELEIKKPTLIQKIQQKQDTNNNKYNICMIEEQFVNCMQNSMLDFFNGYYLDEDNPEWHVFYIPHNKPKEKFYIRKDGKWRDDGTFDLLISHVDYLFAYVIHIITEKFKSIKPTDEKGISASVLKSIYQNYKYNPIIKKFVSSAIFQKAYEKNSIVAKTYNLTKNLTCEQPNEPLLFQEIIDAVAVCPLKPEASVVNPVTEKSHEKPTYQVKSEQDHIDKQLANKATIEKSFQHIFKLKTYRDGEVEIGYNTGKEPQATNILIDDIEYIKCDRYICKAINEDKEEEVFLEDLVCYGHVNPKNSSKPYTWY